MDSSSSPRRSWLTWLIVGLLFVLCGVFGFLQYRWIGEVSVAARDRMRADLQASLARLTQAFDSQLVTACSPFVPADSHPDAKAVEQEIEQRFRDEVWHKPALLQQVALAEPRGQTVQLRTLNWQTGVFADAQWPVAWQNARRRLESMPQPPPRPDDSPGRGQGMFRGRGRPPRPRPQPDQETSALYDTFSFETPVFGRPDMRFEEPPFAGGPDRPFPDPPQRPFDDPPQPVREVAWLIFQLDSHYVPETFLPDLVHRVLNSGAADDAGYEVTVVTATPDSTVLYESTPGQSRAIRQGADASAPLFDVPREMLRRNSQDRRPGERGRGDFPPPPDERKGGPGRGPQYQSSRWIMTVRHRAGSLEAAVARTRRANLAVTGVVLLLMMAAVVALIRFTRRAQHLAQLQMDFVAGVSHELRTPLTVIHTAAYNLQGRLSADPRQVERYGALIHRESARLKSLVEQILRFARAEAGKVIESPRPVSIEVVVESAINDNRELIESSGCTVDLKIAPDLPWIQGDATALEQAVSNLVSNAIKYGAPAERSTAGGSSCWLGVSAAMSGANSVEIRVVDRGPGIPRDELAEIFQPFFRGTHARGEQIRGTGLGLTLVKKIVDAHSGTITVNTGPEHGTEFVVCLPAAPLRSAESGADQPVGQDESSTGAVK